MLDLPKSHPFLPYDCEMLLHPTYPYITCDLTLGLAACLHTPFPCDPLWPLALFSLLLNVCP